MSNGTNGGATKNGANTTPAWVEMMMKDNEEYRIKHDQEIEAAFTAANKQVRSAQDATMQGFKQTADLIGNMSKQVADGFEQSRKLADLHYQKTDGKLSDIAHAMKTTPWDVCLAILAGLGCFFGGWNFAAARTTLFSDKFMFGGLGFIIGFAVIVMLASFIRGLRLSRREEAPTQSDKQTPPASPAPATAPASAPAAPATTGTNSTDNAPATPAAPVKPEPATEPPADKAQA